MNSIRSSQQAKIFFGSVITWCVLSTIYFTAVIDNRTMIASTHLRFGTSFAPSRSKRSISEKDKQRRHSFLFKEGFKFSQQPYKRKIRPDNNQPNSFASELEYIVSDDKDPVIEVQQTRDSRHAADVSNFEKNFETRENDSLPNIMHQHRTSSSGDPHANNASLEKNIVYQFQTEEIIGKQSVTAEGTEEELPIEKNTVSLDYDVREEMENQKGAVNELVTTDLVDEHVTMNMAVVGLNRNVVSSSEEKSGQSEGNGIQLAVSVNITTSFNESEALDGPSTTGSSERAQNHEVSEEKTVMLVSKHDDSVNDSKSEVDSVEVEVPATEGKSMEAPACDMMHLANGRFFWRNRMRLVDKDKSEICGPKILIIGSMRCGTNTIAEMLLKHPRIQLNSCNLVNTQGGCNENMFQAALKQGLIFEGHDFTHGRRKMPNGWLDQFGKRLPMTDGINTMTFDKSPSYMDVSIFPDVVEYAKAHLPNAKIVATLCNPAERLYSEYHYMLEKSRFHFSQFYNDNAIDPPNNFSDFVKLLKPDNPICNEKRGFCDSNQAQYLKKGEYLNNLRPWFDGYGDQNVLVVDMDDDPTNIVKRLLEHVGPAILPESEYPWEEIAASFRKSAYAGRSSSYEHFHEDMEWLQQHYAPHNEELAVALGVDWPRKWNCRLTGTCEY
jgi:hypothetical protein